MSETFLLDRTPQGLIGTAMDRPDGPAKVAGEATYAEEFEMANPVYGVLVRSPVALGTLDRIDETSVEDIEGFIKVMTHEKFAHETGPTGNVTPPPQGGRDITYFGQPIGLALAETFEAARDAAMRVELRISEESGGVFDYAGADYERDESTEVSQGDLEQAMADAAQTVRRDYRFGAHHSAAMEMHCAIASWDGDKLLLHTPHQMMKWGQPEIANALGIPKQNVRIYSPYIGGGFGSKLSISADSVAAALASRELGRPVIVPMSRQQVFETTSHRAATGNAIELGADADGKITAFAHHGRAYRRAEQGFVEPLLTASHFLYGGAARSLHMNVAELDIMAIGAVRAPGEAIGLQALEIAMDELAEKLEMDPLDLRLKNIPQRHPEEDIPYGSRKFAEALNQGAEAFGWSERKAQPRARREGEWWIGMGLAAAARVNLTSDSNARVTLRKDGTALVETDMTDIGTGTYAVLTQLAGELLGLSPDKVEVRLGDTDLPDSCGSGGSWGASSAGASVYVAANRIRTRLAEKLGIDAENLVLKDGQAIGENLSSSLGDLLDGEDMCEEGEFKAGVNDHDGDEVSASYGAHFAEVAVNSVTGEVRVKRQLGAFAAGRILNEKTARSQCIGGITWGIGIALTENMLFDGRDGHVVTRDLAEYHVPCHLDVPHQDVIFIDERDDRPTPIQSKGIGELGICGAAGAIVNAIYNACGVRVHDFPATPDRIIAELA